MSRFYGTVSGIGKTTATRRGSENYPTVTQAAAWGGCIETRLFVEDGKDMFEAAMALEDLLLQPLMYIRDKLGDVNWPGSVNYHVMGILSKCEDIIIQSSNEDRL